MKDNELGAYDMSGSLGEVDLFGLNEFGEPAGPGWGPYLGAAVGGAAQAGAVLAVRKFAAPSATDTGSPNLLKHKELVGAGAALVLGAIAAIPRVTRHSAWTMMAAAVGAAVPRYIDDLMVDAAAHAAADKLKADAAKGAAPGVPGAPQAGAWGAYTMDPTGVIRPFQGQMGMTEIGPGYAVHGAGLGAGQRPELVGPPTLVGAGSFGLGARQAQLLGVPGISGIAGHWGTTGMGNLG